MIRRLASVLILALVAIPLATTASATSATCVIPGHLPHVTLSDTSPTPRLTVLAGTRFVAIVPKWGANHDTDLTLQPSGIVREVCSVLTKGGGRRALLVAYRRGTTSLHATVTPVSNLMMPSWSARITVVILGA